MIDPAKLRALRQAGTPGPWSIFADPDVCPRPSIVGGAATNGHDYVVAEISEWASKDGEWTWSDHDARLIVAAVNALPELCDEIERLRAEVASAHASGIERGIREAAKAAEAGPGGAALAYEILALLEPRS